VTTVNDRPAQITPTAHALAQADSAASLLRSIGATREAVMAHITAQGREITPITARIAAQLPCAREADMEAGQ
jgi:hypothetical protein